MMLEITAVVTAFAVGFAMKYGGLCTYAAALQMVREKRLERLMAFFSAAAWAALIVPPMAWLAFPALHLDGTHGQWDKMLAGGILLGLGAYLNRGCVFGTFVQLVGGNLVYVATLVGMVMGALAGRMILGESVPAKIEPALASGWGLPAAIWLLLAMILVMRHARRFRWGSRRGLLVAMVLGIGGGGLFAAVAGWDFAAVLTRTSYHALGLVADGPTMLALYCTLSMVAGGVAAAVSQKAFLLRRPRWRGLFNSLTGGAVMGLGAVVLPGGNDGLLLSGIPVLAPHAVAGFLLMLATMLVLLLAMPNENGFSIAGRSGS